MFAINIVFFPKHFIGYSGFPRRYPDYADAFLGWNLVMNYGSILTLSSKNNKKDLK